MLDRLRVPTKILAYISVIFNHRFLIKSSRACITILMINFILILNISTVKALEVEDSYKEQQISESAGLDYIPQENRSLYTFGIIGNSTFNLQNAFFTELDPLKYPNCCKDFSTGYGLGVNLGTFYRHYISDKISFEYALSLSYYDATLKANETKLVEIDGKVEQSEILHQLESSLRYLEFAYKVKYDFLRGARANFSIFAATPLLADFYQFEALVKPENRGHFENNLRIRNVYSDPIPNLKPIIWGITFGAEYDFFLNKKQTYALSPQVNFGKTMSSLIHTNKWLLSFFRFGFIFSYNSYKTLDSPLEPVN